MIEAIVAMVASAPAGLAGFVSGRALCAWLRRGRHATGVPATVVCAQRGRPVQARRVAAHAA